jgi:hypothetical protein
MAEFSMVLGSGPAVRSRRLPPGTALLWLVPLCGCDEPAVPAAPDRMPTATTRLIEVDGLSITFGDVAAEMAYLDSLAPEWSLRAKIRRVLGEFTLPLFLARREFQKERAEQLGKAANMAAASGNAAELLANARLHVHRHEHVGRRDVEIPISMFLFAEEKAGSVSQPIELPQGFVVAGALDLKSSAAVLDDVCEAVQVAFYTHAPQAWFAWLEAMRERIAQRVTFVHPDFRDAMPIWLKLP